MRVTVLHETRETEIDAAGVEGDSLWLSAADLDRATGWLLTDEGFCRDEACVPAPHDREPALVRGDQVDVAGLWRYLGHPVARDARGEAWVLGTGAQERADALRSLQAPDFALPDLDGRIHTLSEHRGKRVLLVTWASW